MKFKVGDKVKDWQGDTGAIVDISGHLFLVEYEEESLGHSWWTEFDLDKVEEEE